MYCMYVLVHTYGPCRNLEKMAFFVLAWEKKNLPLVQIGPILLPIIITSSRDTNLKLGVSAISYIGAEGKYDQSSPTLMTPRALPIQKHIVQWFPPYIEDTLSLIRAPSRLVT